MQLSPSQLERLCNTVYLNELLPCPKSTRLGQKVHDLREQGCIPIHDFISESDWIRVMDSIEQDPALSQLRIAHFMDFPPDSNTFPGFRAVCFSDEENAYVVFRGTCGDVEWQDNGRGLLQAETEYQIMAADYARKVRAENGLQSRRLILAGHSKGGNKAQYAFITTDADECFSLDGQGFSQEFIEKYQQQIAQKASKIVSYAERRDFVNCLGFYIQQPQFFSGRRGERALPDFPHGQPLPYFHCPDGLRTGSGEFGPPTEEAYFSKVINHFITFLLSAPQYRADRETVAMSIVSLMTRNARAPESELVEAFACLAVLFFDVAVHHRNFNKDLFQLFKNEWAVIRASIRSVSHRKSILNPEQSVLQKIEHRIAEKSMERENGLHNFKEFYSTNILPLLSENSLEAENTLELQQFFSNITEELKQG